MSAASPGAAPDPDARGAEELAVLAAGSHPPVATPAAGRPAAVAIRDAGPADLAALAGLEGLSASTRRQLDVEVARAGARPPGGTVVLVATVGHEVVGAALGLLQVDEGHVVDLAVAPAARRCGIGSRLLRSLLEALRGRGARSFTLEVRAGNLGALSLYRGAGFVVEGRRPRYYPDGEDALLLWLRAGPADGAVEAAGAGGG